MRPLVFVGKLDDVTHFYYPAVAQELYVGYTVSPGGFGYPAVGIQYAPEDLSGVLRVVRNMESQGRLPQVCLEPTMDRLEVAVFFKVSVGPELLLHLLTDGNHAVDLGQLGSEEKVELMATAETGIDLEGMDRLMPWFRAQKFRVVICKMNPWGIEEIY